MGVALELEVGVAQSHGGTVRSGSGTSVRGR